MASSFDGGSDPIFEWRTSDRHSNRRISPTNAAIAARQETQRSFQAQIRARLGAVQTFFRVPANAREPKIPLLSIKGTPIFYFPLEKGGGSRYAIHKGTFV